MSYSSRYRANIDVMLTNSCSSFYNPCESKQLTNLSKLIMTENTSKK